MSASVATERVAGIVQPHGGVLRPWPKGVSGNPTGKGGEYLEACRILSEIAPKAARKAEELLDHEDPRIQAIAMESILKRVVGDRVVLPGAGRIDLTALSAEEREAMAAMLRKAMGL